MLTDRICLRCKGERYTDIDILPGVPHRACHRCNGCGKEPFWAQQSPEAREIWFRRAATAIGMNIILQDIILDLTMFRPDGEKDDA